jgi:uncharacterized membrane protein
MPITTASIEINAPPERVMAVLVDHERYPEFLPYIRDVQVEAVGEGDWRVAYTTHVIRDLNYTLRLIQDATRSLSWSLVEEGVFLRNSGSWTLSALPGGRTRAHHDLELSLAVFLPNNIARSLMERTLPDTLSRFRDEVHRRMQDGS